MPAPIAGAKIAKVLIVIALVYAGFLWEQKGRQKGSVPVHPAACGCEDKADLEARRQQAQAVIDDLQQIVKELEFEGLLDPVPYSTERQTAGRGRNQDALNKANSRNLGGGDTDENCLTKTTGSGCMKAVLQAHENVHEAACSAHKQAGRQGDYKFGKTMAEYWKEDIQGYEAELKFIKEAEDFVDNLNPPCPRVERPSIGGESPEEQMERLHRGRDRVNEYITAIS